MNRATELGSPWIATLAVMPLFMLTVIGCAAPIVPANNVVVDTDVRDCSPGIFDAVGPLDVAIVIDTSQSTRRPTGFDIDGDGRVREYRRHEVVDRDDSRLAAEIAAVRSLLRSAEGRDIRFSIVTFSGTTIARTVGRNQLLVSNRDSKVRAGLSEDIQELKSIVTEVFKRGSDRKTIFSAGMQRATRSLLESRSQLDGQARRRVVLSMSDARRPNSVDAGGSIEDLDPRMKSAAVVAQRNRIVFNTFGLSPDSRQWRDQALGQIAGATGGTYHPIEDPRQLYCHLASSLLPAYLQEQRKWQGAFARYRERQAISSKGAPQPEELPAGQ
jgi:Mg-chelatase subunit ChlD